MIICSLCHILCIFCTIIGSFCHILCIFCDIICVFIFRKFSCSQLLSPQFSLFLTFLSFLSPDDTDADIEDQKCCKCCSQKGTYPEIFPYVYNLYVVCTADICKSLRIRKLLFIHFYAIHFDFIKHIIFLSFKLDRMAAAAVRFAYAV